MTTDNKLTHTKQLNVLINTISLLIVPTAIPFSAYTIGLIQQPISLLLAILLIAATYVSPLYLSEYMTYNEIRTIPFLFAVIIYASGAFDAHTILLITFSIVLATTLIYNITCKKSENPESKRSNKTKTVPTTYKSIQAIVGATSFSLLLYCVYVFTANITSTPNLFIIFPLMILALIITLLILDFTAKPAILKIKNDISNHRKSKELENKDK